ncbi:MAG: Na+/H+ antiporter NhaC family protein [Desulfobacteraceae bacterium]|jgi:Na+/H+ antiporter NhaC
MEGEAVTFTYGALALVPPVLAIVLAIWKRQVIISLTLGVFAGATIVNNWNPLTGLLDTFSKYIVAKSLADAWNVGVVVFCLAIGGLVGVMSRIGGTQAIAEAIARKAQDTRSTLFATALMGIAIFFDDYANSMIVGNTMRPITDKYNIAREKLAYIVDSTAAPISSICPISTWVAMELGLIATAFTTLGIKGNSMVAFMNTIPFRFYSLFTIAFVFILVFMRRDFGLMYKAEKRARTKGEVFAKGSTPMISEDKDLMPDEAGTGSIWGAIIPITLFALVTVFGLWYNGYAPGKTIRECFGDADASVVLTWAAFISSIVAIVIGRITGKFKLAEGVDAWVAGLKTMLIAVIILTLAFSLKAVITEMQLAEWIVANSKDILSGAFLPSLTFILAFFIAFATGTSWGTNAILMPIIIPLAVAISGASTEVTTLMYSSMGAVLTGAVCGDHCSPISDTTILSSTASGSDHIDHVRTQLPYSLTVAGFALVFGYIPTGFGISPWISIAAGIIGMAVFMMFVGKKVEDSTL